MHILESIDIRTLAVERINKISLTEKAFSYSGGLNPNELMKEAIKRHHYINKGINMIEYMKRHERYVREMLSKNLQQEALQELSQFHDKQIRWMQHERIVHLITMLFVCLFTLLSLGFAVLRPALPGIALCALLMILTVAYVIHYYRLENGVQRWYDLADKIKQHNHS